MISITSPLAIGSHAKMIDVTSPPVFDPLVELIGIIFGTTNLPVRKSSVSKIAEVKICTSEAIQVKTCVLKIVEANSML